jgi:hypothetical protein
MLMLWEPIIEPAAQVLYGDVAAARGSPYRGPLRPGRWLSHRAPRRVVRRRSSRSACSGFGRSGGGLPSRPRCMEAVQTSGVTRSLIASILGLSWTSKALASSKRSALSTAVHGRYGVPRPERLDQARASSLRESARVGERARRRSEFVAHCCEELVRGALVVGVQDAESPSDFRSLDGMRF